MGKCSEIYKLVYAKIIEGYPISTFFFTFWTAFAQQHYNLQHSQGYFPCPRVLNLQSWSFLLFCFSTQPQKLMLKFDIERLQRMPPLVTSNFFARASENRSSSAARLVLLQCSNTLTQLQATESKYLAADVTVILKIHRYK